MTDAFQPVAPYGLEKLAFKVGAVSYLNTLPLIHGLQGSLAEPMLLDVPGKLFERLEAGRVDVALCPVVDLIQHDGFEMVPCGGIGCSGPTLTVRLFSRVPIEQVDTVWADVESHTSVALLKVLWRCRFQRPLEVVPFDAERGDLNAVATALLIGDKVVTDAPHRSVFPHELDLGQAWHAWTGLPFVFAVWGCPEGAVLGDLPLLMHECLTKNLASIDEIANDFAPQHGWSVELASRYLGRILQYRIDDQSLAGIRRFAELGAAAGLWPEGAGPAIWGQARQLVNG